MSSARSTTRTWRGPNASCLECGEHLAAGDAFRELPWRHVAPCGGERDAKASCLRRPKAHVGGALASPPALHRHEHGRLGADEGLLLLRSQLDHSPVLVRVGEGCEDLSANPKIRMPHVSAFGRLGHAQGQTPKALAGHEASLAPRSASSALSTER